MPAVKAPKDNLFFKILPQSLNLLDVLKSVPQEVAFSVSDVQQDDFMMFRYEL